MADGDGLTENKQGHDIIAMGASVVVLSYPSKPWRQGIGRHGINRSAQCLQPQNPPLLLWRDDSAASNAAAPPVQDKTHDAGDKPQWA